MPERNEPSQEPSPELRRLRHDIRGAFNELSLCVEVLRVETDADRLPEWLDQIEAAAGRCEALVAQLLALE